MAQASRRDKALTLLGSGRTPICPRCNQVAIFRQLMINITCSWSTTYAHAYVYEYFGSGVDALPSSFVHGSAMDKYVVELARYEFSHWSKHICYTYVKCGRGITNTYGLTSHSKRRTWRALTALYGMSRSHIRL